MTRCWAILEIPPTNDVEEIRKARRPPRLTINPQTVSKAARGCYTIRVEDGSAQLLDVQVRLPDKSNWSTEAFGWPQLDAGGTSAPVCVEANTPPGRYTFVKMKTHGTTEWVGVNDYVDVVP